jgi:uncharacterized protein with ParB-like and HNH nuclease domain
MERNKINFVTGETYTLAELFSEDRFVIIPDLQRDYCWGDDSSSKNGELVTDFVRNLMEQYVNHSQDNLNLGLFYGYEVPANHIQLCDGQQRLTTLFLLLGMLNKRVGTFRRHLISDYEYEQDDKEPYLNYAIRESSLYFLSDLVCNFFIPNDSTVDSIRKTADWYFEEYNLDPSIQSMLRALQKIEKLIKDKEDDWLQSFGDWMLNRLTFLYFDMKNRKNGEETFVIINTTGDPLSAAQNLKALMIEAPCNKDVEDIDKKWEDIETWFWRKRLGENDTADVGFEEFLRWVWIIELSKSGKKDELIQLLLKGDAKEMFPYLEIRFKTIYDYWNALKWIYEENKDLSFHQSFLSPAPTKKSKDEIVHIIGQNDCFVLLPVLHYVKKFYDRLANEETVRNVKRVYEFFNNLIRINNVSKAVNSLVREAIYAANQLKDGDILSLLTANNVSKQILTEEELLKLKLLREADNRKELEELFWSIQPHDVWQGEIMPMIKWAMEEQSFYFDKFKQYAEAFKILFEGDFEHEDKVNLLRRCMIVCQEPYKPIQRGMYFSFGWEWSDWHELLCRDGVKGFFDYYIDKSGDESYLSAYISEFAKEKDYIEFAEDDYLLSFTNNSNACDMYFGHNDWQITTSGGTGRHTSFFSRKNAYILKSFNGSSSNNSSNKKTQIEGNDKWYTWYYCSSVEDNCVVFESKYGIKLDVRFLTNSDKDSGKLEIVLKTTDNKNMAKHMDVLSALNIEMDTNGNSIISQSLPSFNVTETKSKILSVISKIDEVKNK